MFYSTTEVEKECNQERKLIIINKNVYNVASYLEEHPGGPEIIEELIGTDATSAFNDVGHSQDALSQLKTLSIGEYHNTVEKTYDDDIDSTDFGATTGIFLSIILSIIFGFFYYILFG